MVLHPSVALAFDCTNYNNISYNTKCKIKLNGIRFLRKNQGYKFMEKILELYNDIYELKSVNIGEGHHQTIDITRMIVEIENRITKMKIANKHSRIHNQQQQPKNNQQQLQNRKLK